MNKPNRPIRKFSPGMFQSDKEIIDQFVVRKHELDIVLEVLRGNIDSPSCQHVLVVAPRGQGKTMLLTRVAAEVNTDDELSACLLPVRFMEESYEIFNLADFWLDTLFHLARESAKCDSELARELRETHADLTTHWQEKNFSDRVRAAVLEAADRLGKKLVLMVENLEALYKNVDKDFGWKLRGVLQSDPQIMLIATATSRFEDLDDVEQPFFELFRIVDLEPLTTEECRRLWQVVSGDDLPRAIRPLEILTGGSPRLLVIVAGFARHRSLRQLMEELVALIDEHTEYFRSYLENLAKSERRVYISMIDLWEQGPSSAAEIATRARMDVRPVSALLGRLVERGAVVVEEKGKKQRYAPAERLYSIYYKLRRERDEATVVANLIRFMKVFYGDAELAEIREDIERAVAEWPQLGHSLSVMERSGIDRPSIPAAGTDNESVKQLLEEITTAYNEGALDKVIEIVDQAFTAQSANCSRIPDSLIALKLIKAIAHQERGKFEAAIEACNEVISQFDSSDNVELQHQVACAWLIKGDVQRQRDEFEAAIEACDKVISQFDSSDNIELQHQVARAWLDKGDVQRQRDEFEAAIEAYDKVISQFDSSDNVKLQHQVACAWLGKGLVQRQRDEFEAAIEAYDKVISQFDSSDNVKLQHQVACAWLGKGLVQRQRDEFEAAIEAYDKVISQFDSSDNVELQHQVARAWLGKGFVQGQRGEFEAAIEAYDKVISQFDSSDNVGLQGTCACAWLNKGSMQVRRGEFEAAIEAYDEGTSRIARIGSSNEFNRIVRFGSSNELNLKLQGTCARVWFNKGLMQERRGEFEAAIETYDKVIESFASSDEVEFQQLVADALSRKGRGQIEMGLAEEALNTCRELELRLGALTENEKPAYTWRAMCTRALALLAQGRYQAAMDAFRFAYVVFAPSNEAMMYDMQKIVPELIATGASERDLVEILSSDKAKSSTLAPLIVALQQRTGEKVRSPVEVLEVAADILKRIKARAAKGTPVAS